MANSRMHWRVKQKTKKAYWDSCDIYRALWLRNGRQFERAKIRATIFCGGRMDHDNAIARLKWPVDFLVTQGLLAGDKPSQLSWHWPIEQVVKRNQEYRVEITIEEDA